MANTFSAEVIIDTSAMMAILYHEPEAPDSAPLVHDAETCRISVATYVELSMVIESQLGFEGMRQAEAFFRRAAIVVEPLTIEQGELAPKLFSAPGRDDTRRA